MSKRQFKELETEIRFAALAIIGTVALWFFFMLATHLTIRKDIYNYKEELKQLIIKNNNNEEWK